MKEMKNYEKYITRYILETAEDINAFKDEIRISSDHDGVVRVVHRAERTMPLMREVFASNLDLIVSINVKKEEGYHPKIVIPKIEGIRNNSHVCASIYHREDLYTPIASIGFNPNNERYVLRNKAIKRGGEEREYWDNALKESKHLKNIMGTLRQTMSRIVPRPQAFLSVLLERCENYRYSEMSRYIEGKEISAISADEIQHMISSGYEPTPHSLLARVIYNYRDNFDTYDKAKKYSPMVYHARRIDSSDDLYIAKLRYPSWADTEGSTMSTSSVVRQYLIENPIKEVRYKHADIPTYIERTMAMLDLKDSTSNSTSSYIEGMGIKISSNRYWAIDENNEVNLDV
jgi:hypothetical protein